METNGFSTQLPFRLEPDIGAFLAHSAIQIDGITKQLFTCSRLLCSEIRTALISFLYLFNKSRRTELIKRLCLSSRAMSPSTQKLGNSGTGYIRDQRPLVQLLFSSIPSRSRLSFRLPLVPVLGGYSGSGHGCFID